MTLTRRQALTLATATLAVGSEAKASTTLTPEMARRLSDADKRRLAASMAQPKRCGLNPRMHLVRIPPNLAPCTPLQLA